MPAARDQFNILEQTPPPHFYLKLVCEKRKGIFPGAYGNGCMRGHSSLRSLGEPQYCISPPIKN